MRKSKQRHASSDIYVLVKSTQMSEADRKAAENALLHAEAIVDALLWARDRIVAAGNYFLKPSLKN